MYMVTCSRIDYDGRTADDESLVEFWALGLRRPLLGTS